MISNNAKTFKHELVGELKRKNVKLTLKELNQWYKDQNPRNRVL